MFNATKVYKDFTVKVYTDVAVAAAEARAWLQEKFPHPCGQFELLESHDPHEGMEELADSEDIGRYLDRELAELDERSGYLICKSIKNIGLREFLYWPDEDDWEITGVSDEGKSDSFTDRLAGCRLPHREGVAVFYNNGPTKDDDFLLAVVKRSMYEQMGEHLEDTLQPSRYFGEGGQGDRTCLIIPAVFVTDKRQSHAEFIVDELRDELGLDKITSSSFPRCGPSHCTRRSSSITTKAKLPNGCWAGSANSWITRWLSQVDHQPSSPAPSRNPMLPLRVSSTAPIPVHVRTASGSAATIRAHANRGRSSSTVA
jgi:hypothetical protein